MKPLYVGVAAVTLIAVVVVVNLAVGTKSTPSAPPSPAKQPTIDLRSIQSSQQYAKGQQLFQSVCTLCHMEHGEGQPGTVPSLHGAPIATGDANAFARILLHGMEGPVEVKGVKYEGIMPPATFDSDEDLAAVITFVRNSWGNASGAVTPDLIAKVKSETQGRQKAWTAPELGK